jgi:hypothetical protein
MSNLGYDPQYNHHWQQEHVSPNYDDVFTFRDLDREYKKILEDKDDLKYVGNATLYDQRYFDILIKLKEQNNLLHLKLKEYSDINNQNYHLGKTIGEKENFIKNLSEENL